MFKHPNPETQVRPTVDCGPGKTKQNMAKETDINLIMAKYKKTGLVNFVNNRQAEYMTVDENFDFHECMNRVVQAQEMFLELPAQLRKKFNNDPGEFLAFAQDENNIDAMVDLGLAQRNPEQQAAYEAAQAAKDAQVVTEPAE